MKKEDLLKLEHLEVIREDRLLQLKVEKGYVICNYKEGMDMNEYMSTQHLILPVRDEYIEEYSTITYQENKQHLAEKYEAMEEDNE